jgi:hypothetical protein
MMGTVPDTIRQPGGSATIALAAIWLLAAQTVLADDDELLAVLDASGAVIDSVIIRPESIFDLDNPKENSLFYRLANKLHITTKPEVIEQQTLFVSGDEFSARLLEETERKLRANRYIQDASVEPRLNDDGTVDVDIKTSDTWTLMPKLSFSRAGGVNKSEIGIRDMNLLGRGIQLEAAYASNVDRTSTMLNLTDNNVGNSWYRLNLDLQDSSDGHTRGVQFGIPFYALDSTRAHGFSYYDNERVDAIYDLGKKTGEYTHRTNSYEIFRGWSSGLKNDKALRYTAGVAYDEHRFSAADTDAYAGTSIPDDRQLFYPFFGMEWVEDNYVETRNADQLDRTEDFYLGTRVAGRVGYASDRLGSDRSSWLLGADAQTGFGDITKRALFLDGSLDTRIERGALHDFGLSGGARYYDRQSQKRLFFASLSGFYGRNLDADHQLYLGGDTGLRGYPLRYQSGDSSILLTLEQRYYTDWYPFRLFRVGGAVFFDMGRTWGEGPNGGTNNGWLRNVGFGLRLGSTRSGLGKVVHIDLAYPLDGDASMDNVQFLISAKHGF